MPAPAHESGRASAQSALDRALQQSGAARREQLAVLTKRYPEHAPIWLALAEDFLAQRRIERALDAFERALALEPAQERFASPKLEAARRYHDREAAPRYQPAPREDQAPAALAPASGFSLPVSAPVPKSGPNERTKRVPMSAIERPRAKPVPPYLRTPSGSYRPTCADSQFNGPIGPELSRALEWPAPAQRLAALRNLEAQAPDHPGVLFHLAVHLVLADQLADARRVGQTLWHVDEARYRQLYDWADEWARTAPPAEFQRAANARTLCLELPASLRAPAMPADTGPKTQLLAVPVPMLLAHGSAPHAIAGPHPAPDSASPARPDSRLRTAGALVAGIAAGLLVAMLLVFMINSAGSLASPEATEPRATVGSQETRRPSAKSKQSKEGPLTAAEQAVVDSIRAESP